ncbi:hypothetical protein [Geomonas ferrireducens]|uniref:hypothetical protein n=1 Tax=Geomonas ferrireducens TaxID=2570227 RepID=UPI0010A8F8F0|nr:hypothetical protein [Geomonas ferrireducens]
METYIIIDILHSTSASAIFSMGTALVPPSVAGSEKRCEECGDFPRMGERWGEIAHVRQVQPAVRWFMTARQTGKAAVGRICNAALLARLETFKLAERLHVLRAVFYSYQEVR